MSFAFFSKKQNPECEQKESELYFDLAADDEIENGDEYLRALNWAIRNDRIKNIALTGPYGSGKSSIIQTYIKKGGKLSQSSNKSAVSSQENKTNTLCKSIKKTNRSDKYLQISLASFMETSEVSDNESPENKIIEGSLIKLSEGEIAEGILKQLFYRVKKDDIPLSRYRKLQSVEWKSLILPFFISLGIEKLLFAFTYVFFPSWFSRKRLLVLFAQNRLHFPSWSTFLVIAACFLGMAALITFAYKLLRESFRIKEIQLAKDVNIKADSEGTSSIFNKYLDEIVYFFEETKYNVVFFEDLDRLQTPNIFVQLRELNTLLNNDDAIPKSVKPIKFVYAVRDDIFAQGDRTKFFEFIVPVIPVINSTNSGEILLTYVEQSKRAGNAGFNISSDYIKDVSPYISDMRILKNAYNEFVMYKATLQQNQDLTLQDEMMFSLILFKNLSPHDFAELQNETGIVKEAFESKRNFIKALISEIQETIDASTALITSVETDNLQSVEELKMSLAAVLTNWTGVAVYVRSDVKRLSINDIFHNPSILESILKSSSQIYVDYIPWNNIQSGFYYSNCPSMLLSTSSIVLNYLSRISDRERVNVATVEGLQEEIELRKEQKRKLSSLNLKEILAKYPTKDVLSEDVRQNPFLVFALRNGYIDERYVDYINYFKGTSITTSDMNFILSIKNRSPLDYDYHLDRVENIVPRLLPHEFEQREILNFALLEHLLSSDSASDKLAILIGQLCKNLSETWDFIDEFASRQKYLDTFISLLVRHCPKLWLFISSHAVLSYDRKLFYFRQILLNIDQTNQLNIQKSINTFVESHNDILQKLKDVPADRIISLIKDNNIRFRDIQITDVPGVLLDFIFDENRHQVNIQMIRCIVQYRCPDLLEKIQIQNYTCLLAMNYPPLLSEIEDNWKEYLSSIVLQDDNTYESVDAILQILERTIDDTDMCRKIIEHETFVLENLSICLSNQIGAQEESVKAIWNILLNKTKVAATWDNIVIYWQQYGFTHELCEFVSQQYSIIRCSQNDHPSEFIQDFIASEVSEKAFRSLLKHLPVIGDLDFTKIHEVRLKYLIQIHYIHFSVEIYDKLADQYPTLCADFILSNQSEYMVCADEIKLDESLIETIFFSDEGTHDLKQNLLDRYGEKHMSSALAEHLCQPAVPKYSIPQNIFSAIMKLVGEDDAVRYMFKYLDVLTASEFQQIFKKASLYSKLADRTRHNVLLSYTPQHEELAEKLKAVGYITSWQRTKSSSGNSSQDIIKLIVKESQKRQVIHS